MKKEGEPMQLTITLPDNGHAAHIIETTARAEHVSREEAAARLLEALPFARRSTPIPGVSADRRAAVEAGLGFAQGDEWSVADFNADKDTDIERELARDFV